MIRAACALVLTLAVAAPAMAREPFDDLFFVKRDGTAAQMLADRTDCRQAATSVGSGGAYNDPEYGAAAALGESLDSDALHNGGLTKRFQLAVMKRCMERHGWLSVEPTREEARAISRASARHPEALDAWIKARTPPAPAVAAAAEPAKP